jgi:beta-1,4-mannosyltransferase
MSLHVVFFPELSDANPYGEILTSELECFDVKVIGMGKRPFGRRWLLLNRRRIQVLHFHYVQQFYAYEAVHARLRWVLRFASNLLLARLLGYRTVFTLHNATPTYPLQPDWVDMLGHWVAANLTHSVIVHCEAARQLLKEKFGRRKHVHIVSHPHYMDQYENTITQSAARAALRIAPENLVFAFIGGIRPNKGVEHLIKAFNQLNGDYLTLIIAGKLWPPETYIRALERSVVADSRVLLHKRFIPNEELQVYFNAVDVVVLPFERILTSGSAILAMGFARPVVAPAKGCLSDLITADVGILYDPASPTGLLEALMQCVEKRSDLARMGECSQQRVAELTGRLMARQTLGAYGVHP